MKYRIGVDLGGTKMFVSLANGDGEIFRSQRVPTKALQGPSIVLNHLKSIVNEIIAQDGISLKDVEGLGVCIAGFFDIRSKRIVSSPNLPGWELFPLEDELTAQYDLPVIVENDANAAAYGEYVFGAGKDKNNMIFITLGTGIGGGIITDGKLLRGSRGFAGEIGHMIVLPQGPPCGCGKFGCLESFSSGSAIEREGRMLLQEGRSSILSGLAGPGSVLSASHVFAAAREGDKEALKIVERAAYFLGLALSFTVNLLNPDVIVMGGGMAHSGEIFFNPVRRCLEEAAIAPAAKMVSLVPSCLGDEAGVKGVLALLDDHLQGK
ncbi:MAG: ROK family protein [Bacillota bacterium]|nr:ROK family protein [Bacillota bacterium]